MRRPTRQLVVIILSCAALAVGCGGSDEASDTPGDDDRKSESSGRSVISAADAEVGQCLQIREGLNAEVNFAEADCNAEHNGQVVGVADITAENLELVQTLMSSYCADLIEAEILSELTDYLDSLNAVLEDPTNIKIGDRLVCYVEADGLTASLL